jgi:hypothetical protein
MFFQQLFLIIIISLSFAFNVHGIETISYFFPEKEVRVVPCEDCPIPGKECRNYIITNTNKFCLSSSTEEKQNNKLAVGDSAEEEKQRNILHEEAGTKDLLNIQDALDYPEYGIQEPVNNIDMNMTLEKEPLVENYLGNK